MKSTNKRKHRGKRKGARKAAAAATQFCGMDIHSPVHQTGACPPLPLSLLPKSAGLPIPLGGEACRSGEKGEGEGRGKSTPPHTHTICVVWARN